jgi:hypothetical protein
MRKVENMMPEQWDKSAWQVARLIEQHLSPLTDPGTPKDSGGGDGIANLWMTFGGVEFFITVEKSSNQKRREAN